MLLKKFLFLVYGQDQSHGQAYGGDDQPLRDGGSSSSSTAVRQRWQGAHGEIRYVLHATNSLLGRKCENDFDFMILLYLESFFRHKTGTLC